MYSIEIQDLSIRHKPLDTKPCIIYHDICMYSIEIQDLSIRHKPLDTKPCIIYVCDRIKQNRTHLICAYFFYDRDHL